jgi:hypothetical protein
MRRNRRIYMTRLIVAFRYFANAPKTVEWSPRSGALCPLFLPVNRLALISYNCIHILLKKREKKNTVEYAILRDISNLTSRKISKRDWTKLRITYLYCCTVHSYDSQIIKTNKCTKMPCITLKHTLKHLLF